MDGNNMNNENVTMEAVNETYTTAENSYDYAAYDTETAQPTGNGLAIASMILGIVAIVIFFLLLCCGGLVAGIVATPFAIVGLILGIMAKKKEQAKGMWLTGIICSAIALAIGVLMIVFGVISLVVMGVGTSASMLEMMDSSGTFY